MNASYITTEWLWSGALSSKYDKEQHTGTTFDLLLHIVDRHGARNTISGPT